MYCKKLFKKSKLSSVFSRKIFKYAFLKDFKLKTEQKIFYSWQSDLPKDSNLNGIRQSLRNAANEIENNDDEIRIDLDEATRNTSGSPNIPLTIFDKIDSCDVFICDVTTINSGNSDNRKMPNPNVLIELGYAISALGWGRIIMVFNTNYGSFPNDLPFDVDRHRATVFSIKDKTDKVGKSQLSSVLKNAIEAIIKAAPLKPNELKNLSPTEIKRKKDVENLKQLLNYVHVPTVDLFLEDVPSTVIDEIFYYQEGFREFLESNSFHIYDKKLLKILIDLNNNWKIILSYGKHYDSERIGNNYKFYIPYHDKPGHAEAFSDYNYLLKVRLELEKNFKNLFKLIRLEYLEIDLDESSKKAFEMYQEHN